jgi:hypothetical protein
VTRRAKADGPSLGENPLSLGFLDATRLLYSPSPDGLGLLPPCHGLVASSIPLGLHVLRLSRTLCRWVYRPKSKQSIGSQHLVIAKAIGIHGWAFGFFLGACPTDSARHPVIQALTKFLPK